MAKARKDFKEDLKWNVKDLYNTEEEYEKYAGVYKNALEEIKLAEGEKDGQEGKPGDEEEMIDLDYELLAYSSTKIDYEYIISLIQNIVASNEEIEEFSKEERQKQIAEVKQYIEEMRKDNWKVAELMTNLIHEIEEDENKYKEDNLELGIITTDLTNVVAPNGKQVYKEYFEKLKEILKEDDKVSQEQR